MTKMECYDENEMPIPIDTTGTATSEKVHTFFK